MPISESPARAVFEEHSIGGFYRRIAELS